MPEANQERAELRKCGYRGVLLHLGANDRDPPLEGAFAEASIPPAEYCADTPRATPVVGGSAWVSLRLELLQEFDHGLLVFGAQLAEAPNDLARVTPISL